MSVAAYHYRNANDRSVSVSDLRENQSLWYEEANKLKDGLVSVTDL